MNGDKKVEIEVNDSDFKEKVIEASKKVPIVVDFWAPWCGPCNILIPIIGKVAKEYKDKLVLAKLNVEKNHATATEYQIMSIPSIKMFKNGKVVDGFIGALPEHKIREWLDKNL